MRKRTLVDVALLVLLLSVAWQVWSGRVRRRPPEAEREVPGAQPTPRMQDLMRRGAGDLEPALSPSPRSAPSPAPALAAVPESAAPALLLVEVRSPDGRVPAGDIFLSSEDGEFRQSVPGGRLALRSEPGPLRLYAGVQDAAGLRTSPFAEVDLLSGESTRLTLEIPDPELRLPGFRLRPGDLYAEVLTVTPGSAAALAGLHAGDAVLAIDNIAVAGLNAEQVESLLLGPPDQPLLLRLVIRDEEGELREMDALIGR